MRRTVLLCAVALAACAKTEKAPDTTAAAPPPAPPPPVTLADVAGTWEIKSMPMDKDTVVATAIMTSTATMDGWTMTLPPSKTKIPVKVESMGGDSIVTSAGPFASVVRKGQRVSIHSISHYQGGKLTGVNHAKYANGDTLTLRLEGTRQTTP